MIHLILRITMIKLTEQETHLMLHMVGANDRYFGQGYRNYAAFYPSSEGKAIMDSLVQKGAAVFRGERLGMMYWSATKSGCIAAGVTKAGTERACPKEKKNPPAASKD